MSTTAPDNRLTEYNPVTPTFEFAAGFPIFSDEDISVTVDGLERYDFSVSATYENGVSTNAKVVFSSGVTGLVFVIGARSPRRSNRFKDGAPLPTRDQNLALDVIQGEVQEARRDIGRAVKVGFGDGEQSLPSPEAGKYLGWGGRGCAHEPSRRRSRGSQCGKLCGGGAGGGQRRVRFQ
ncbi:hypothetical protein [Shinella sp. M27]|uniref:hypothetical protein n=1 Tax=Shinella sp. M27 TaxID=3368614 RepID=UPI003B9F6CBA